MPGNYAKKKRVYRKRPYRKRRFYKKRRFGKRRRIPGIHIKQRLQEIITIPSGVNNFIHSNNNVINDIPNYTELNRVFKYFKITGVKLQYFPTNLENSPLMVQSTCASVVDLDGTNAPVPFAAQGLLDNSSSHVSQWSNIGGKMPSKSLYYKPRTNNLLSTDNTGVTGVVGLARPHQWYPLESANDLLHYGSHVGWFAPSNYPVSQDMFLITTLYISLKGIK